MGIVFLIRVKVVYRFDNALDNRRKYRRDPNIFYFFSIIANRAF